MTAETLLRMLPSDQWVSAPALKRANGGKRVDLVMQTLLAKGLVLRRQNPEYRDRGYGNRPYWLYRKAVVQNVSEVNP